MNIKRDIFNITVIYTIAMIYVIVTQELFGIIFFIIALYLITIYFYLSIQHKLNKDKKSKIGVVLQQLDQTQKESDEIYKRFLSLSKTIGSGVLMVDVEGKIIFSNKDMEFYFGIDFNNKDYNECTKIKSLYKFIDKAYLTESKQQKQIKNNERFYELISTPLFEGDLFNGTLILVHDITLLKNAEKLQKRFTADVSHELRTPLSAIKGFSEILNRDQVMKEKDQKEFLSLISNEAERMDAILSDLLVISKLDRLDYEIDLQIHEISEVLNESITVLKTKIADKGLKLTTNIAKCELSINKVKFSQVILNILKNAINYTDSGYIDITSKVCDSDYVITISDSGIGIPESKRELIFKRFYRVDKARSRDTGGSGLGLSITKNVVLKHGGTITVESEEEKGSKFIISLPVKD